VVQGGGGVAICGLQVGPVAESACVRRVRREVDPGPPVGGGARAGRLTVVSGRRTRVLPGIEKKDKVLKCSRV
jgi:hypothetical protein